MKMSAKLKFAKYDLKTSNFILDHYETFIKYANEIEKYIKDHPRVFHIATAYNAVVKK